LGVKQSSDAVASKGSDASSKADEAGQHAQNAEDLQKLQPPADKVNQMLAATE